MHMDTSYCTDYQHLSFVGKELLQSNTYSRGIFVSTFIWLDFVFYLYLTNQICNIKNFIKCKLETSITKVWLNY